MASLLSFALAMLVATVLLPFCQRLAISQGILLDLPTSGRKVHTATVARSGGFAILGGSIVAAGFWLDWELAHAPLVGSILIVAFFGFIDDLQDIDYRIKLAGQVFAAGLFLYSYSGFLNVPFFPLGQTHWLIATVISFLFLIGVTNAVNLSDGLDGLAAGNSLLSFGVIALFAFQLQEFDYMIISLAVAGGLVGFLRFNTHPATIFMGDMGSQVVGFTGGALTLLLFSNESFPVSPAVVLLLFGLPILDTLSVIALRLLKKRPVFGADRSHIHHQMLRLGMHHYEVVAAMYVLQAICVALAYFMRYEPDWVVAVTYLSVGSVIMGCIGALRFSGWRLRSVDSTVSSYPARERRNYWLRKLSWYQRNTAKVVGGTTGGLFLLGAWYASTVQGVAGFPSWSILAGVLLALALFLRPGSEVVARLISYLASAATIYVLLFRPTPIPEVGLIDLYILILTGMLILAIRVTRREDFHLDTQDYLVALLVALTPLFISESISESSILRVVIYLAVFFYACEYVLTKGHNSKWLLNITGLLAIIAATL